MSSITRKSKTGEIFVMGGAEMLMARAMRILNKEIEMLERATSSRNLDDKEARKLQGYIKCIVDLSKERREQDKDIDLAGMPREKAIEHLKGVIHKLEGAK